ncbi:zinc finger CCHC domain-containing protein 8 homolog isoform X2 [Brevipalpus obovatus]|uniref:zinc finger CCHC domain-containing protein 8 homolog isoform X2 n=1 Tax=Brevipalpus obovatus TaxID=246614 RepID=UPI003D9DE873
MAPKRYFSDDEKGGKPGQISEELREALNLHPNKLPFWIYKMRVLGYPPGWLRRANITNTSLELFNDDHKPDPSKFPGGEIAYNPDCFIEFPGFNAPVPKGVHEDSYYLGMPPLQEYQQLKIARKIFKPPRPTPYRRLKISESPSSGGPSDNDRPKTKSSPKNCEPGEIIDDDEEEDDDDVQVIQVKEGGSEIITLDTSDTVDEDQISENIDKSEKNETPGRSENRKDNENETETKDNGETVDKNETLSTPKKVSKPIGELKLIAHGSPVPNTLGSKKPPLENFAVGMGELIYFENLPSSTGAFQKMCSVLRDVRKKMSQ